MATMFIAGANVISVSTPKRRRGAEHGTAEPGVAGDVAPRQPDPDHPSRYHVVIPQRDHQLGSITVLADWVRSSRD